MRRGVLVDLGWFPSSRLFDDRSLVKLELPSPHFQAESLIVIHKWLKPVIPAWTAGIQSQGGESAGWCVA